MYADDLILLSVSISDMQKMLLICKKSLDDLDLDIYIDKSACMRIGLRYVKTDISLLLNDKQLKWKSEIPYLGVYILAGKAFKCNIQKSKLSFLELPMEFSGKLSLSHLLL